MRKRRLILIFTFTALVVVVAVIIGFGNDVLMKANTEAYMKMSLVRTYSNLTKKNKNISKVFKSLSSKPLKIEVSTETTNTNISVSSIKIKNISLISNLVWDRGDIFFAKNRVQLGIFRLADINIFWDKDEISLQVPQLIDEYVVFDKSKLPKYTLEEDIKNITEIVDETASLFSGAVYFYKGREEVEFAGVIRNLHKIKTVLLKNDVESYIQQINQNIKVTDDVNIYLYTNEKHEIAAIEIENIAFLPFETEIKFALLGEKWLLSDFAYDIKIVSSKMVQAHAQGGISLYEKNKIALTIEPFRIVTDIFREGTEADGQIKAVLGELSEEISFPKNRSIRYEDLQKEKLNEIANKIYEIMKYLD